MKNKRHNSLWTKEVIARFEDFIKNPPDVSKLNKDKPKYFSPGILMHKGRW